MNAVKVEYKVRPEFAATNKANITRVMDALRVSPIEGLAYIAFTRGDGQSFVHINVSKDEATLAQFTGTAEFKAFQQALKESDPLEPPKPEELTLVGASFAI